MGPLAVARAALLTRPGAPWVLDLFCGAGGAGMGYWLAGFNVLGVDIADQPRYPFWFVQSDALALVREHGAAFDLIHASPPCQGYSRLRHLPWLKDKIYPMLIDPVRQALDAIGKPWVIENVEDAPLRNGITLCGATLGLPVYRHRRFESNHLLLAPPHCKHEAVIGAGNMLNDRLKGRLNAGSSKGSWGQSPLVTVAGGQFLKKDGERALGIYWMSKDELAQAIPPAYTEYIGRQMMRALDWQHAQSGAPLPSETATPVAVGG